MADEFVEMTGAGSASGVPDVAVLTLRVEFGAGQVEEALEGSARATEAVVAGLRGGGIDAADLKTASIRIDTRWNPQSSVADGYTASQGLTVRVRDVTKIGRVVTECAASGGDSFRMDGLAWSFSDPARLHHRARELAWLDAREKAVQVTELSGRGLGDVVRITETPEPGLLPRPSFRLAAADAGSMPTEVGEDSVEVSLLVRWRLAALD